MLEYGNVALVYNFKSFFPRNTLKTRKTVFIFLTGLTGFEGFEFRTEQSYKSWIFVPESAKQNPVENNAPLCSRSSLL